ncbi:class I SAM-dependent methyltransferase [Blastomonas sp. AAP53]|uniref:class I SAM-dependent methyltransferase n=1 Tax=Blastomonas sp. AAP53 TaxID=1248760 RepID=UPI0002E89AE7|nr:class I SAM-dependent methyltransferase [Blastomonas sp. AAP53]
MTQIAECRLLYEQTQFPIFQNRMYSSVAEARDCQRGDIRLVEDQRSGLIYNAAFRADVMDYDENYQNEQAVSAHFRAHLDIVADIVERNMGLDGLVEVGCGKGTFLEMLAERGAQITGFDPTYEGDSPQVKREYFRPGVGIQGRGLILRHVLEHVIDPVDFLLDLRKANNGGGLIYIEVPCFDWICDHHAWFDIFYEHVNYFRLGDFQRMFGALIDSGHIFGDQYIYVVADLSTLQRPVFNAAQRAELPAGLCDILGDAQELENAPGVIWGGASKGVIFALMRERAGKPVQAVIDINPAKQGRYLAATGLQVRAPDEVLPGLADGTVIFVMNSNYLEEIKASAGPRFRYCVVDQG